eukprot:11193703-Lingulodinium_polyedra.AAC.1
MFDPPFSKGGGLGQERGSNLECTTSARQKGAPLIQVGKEVPSPGRFCANRIGTQCVIHYQ